MGLPSELELTRYAYKGLARNTERARPLHASRQDALTMGSFTYMYGTIAKESKLCRRQSGRTTRSQGTGQKGAWHDLEADEVNC